MSAGEVLVEMQGKTWTPAAGMNFLPSPSTDVETFYRQGIAEFLNGTKALNEANWKAWVEQLYALGADKWEQEAYEYAKANNFLQ